MLRVPSFVRTVYSSGKNKVEQTLIEPFSIQVSELEETREGELAYEHNGLKFNISERPPSTTSQNYLVVENIDSFRNGRLTSNSAVKWKLTNISTPSPEDVLNSWFNSFVFKEENQHRKTQGLRAPQLGALYSILGFLKMPSGSGIVVLPTGTGKTETMLSTMIAHRTERLLITVPTDALRTQIYYKFLSLGLLKEFGIVTSAALYPRVGIISAGFKDDDQLIKFVENCNVVITTMSIASKFSASQRNIVTSRFSNVFVDEAHHIAAKTWDSIISVFDEEKVLKFTATPFRNDGKKIGGKVIFNFPLREAQAQGYFKNINFHPIREYDPDKSDQRIAELAIQLLETDLQSGFDHILMARCENKKRADAVFELYKRYTEYSPTLIYSGIDNLKTIRQNIIEKNHRIVVCVDMLGEGFDLPELKIAALHDVRKSLPVTLQYAGRFTRTKYDENLGDATFVANIADLEISESLEKLYSEDSDWNILLSNESDEAIESEIEFKQMISDFEKSDRSDISLQNLIPAMSSVIFRNFNASWNLDGIESYFRDKRKVDYYYSDVNKKDSILIVVYGRKKTVEWARQKELDQTQWNLIVAYLDTTNRFLFVNASDTNSLYIDFAKVLIGDNAQIFDGIDVFKALSGLKRITLKNVGLKEFLGRNIRFRMSVGADVEQALTLAEKQKAQKAFVVGSGFENGIKTTRGCSYKGRVWSMSRGSISNFKTWCDGIGNKLTDPDLDPNEILRETLIPKMIDKIPQATPILIDFSEDIYNYKLDNVNFYINGSPYSFFNTSMEIVKHDEDEIVFSLNTEYHSVRFSMILSSEIIDGERVFSFKYINQTTDSIKIEKGKNKYDFTNYLEEEPLTIWFSDGSALTGNQYVTLSSKIGLYPLEKIVEWDWTNVDISTEAQGVSPKITNSIQFDVLRRLKNKENIGVIYDDDGSGEIADIITIEESGNRLLVGLYHLKYAKDGSVSGRVDNFYEVCGQAQKSFHWKHIDGDDFFTHLLRRQEKKFKGATSSRLEKGSSEHLERYRKLAKRRMPVAFEVFIVQPGSSKEKATDAILSLLAVTENFLKECADMELTVILSK